MNDNTPPADPFRAFEIDVSVTWHQFVTRFVVRQRDPRGFMNRPMREPGTPESLQYLVDGVEVPREDFRAVMDLVTLVSRSRLTSV